MVEAVTTKRCLEGKFGHLTVNRHYGSIVPTNLVCSPNHNTKRMLLIHEFQVLYLPRYTTECCTIAHISIGGALNVILYFLVFLLVDAHTTLIFGDQTISKSSCNLFFGHGRIVLVIYNVTHMLSEWGCFLSIPVLHNCVVI